MITFLRFLSPDKSYRFVDALGGLLAAGVIGSGHLTRIRAMSLRLRLRSTHLMGSTAMNDVVISLLVAAGFTINPQSIICRYRSHMTAGALSALGLGFFDACQNERPLRFPMHFMETRFVKPTNSRSVFDAMFGILSLCRDRICWCLR